MQRAQIPNWKPLALIFVGLAALSTGAARAAEHPDLSGTWRLDAAKSDFGPFPGPGSMTDRIQQQPAEIIVNRDRAGEPVVIHIPLDGSERTNDIRGNTMKTTAHWDGGTLVIDYSGQQRGRPAKSEERWTLAPDGRSMKVVRQLSGPQGATEQTLTMVKQ
jgi:hypothetical protein